MSDEPQNTQIISANPYTLLSQAIEKGFDAERIRQFMDLRDREEARVAERAYAEAMNRVQSRTPIVVRDKKNESTGSWFARLESVNAKIRPIYIEEGFTLEFSEAPATVPENRRITCDVQHIGGHKKQFYLESAIDDVGIKGSANKTKIQGLGSMVTYLRRYLTLNIFNITIADEDEDGNGPSITLNEEEVRLVRDKLSECESAGADVRESQFMDWLAKEQRSDVHSLKDVQRQMLPKALSALDKKLKVARTPK